MERGTETEYEDAREVERARATREGGEQRRKRKTPDFNSEEDEGEEGERVRAKAQRILCAADIQLAVKPKRINKNIYILLLVITEWREGLVGSKCRNGGS